MQVLLAFLAFASWPCFAKMVDFQFALEGTEEEILNALDLKPGDAERRRIFLFDTDELAMFNQKIQVRLRFQEEGVELSIKRWDLSQSDYERLTENLDGSCEKDVHGLRVVRSCIAKNFLPVKKAKALVAGELHLLDVLSRGQLELLMETGSPPLTVLDSLRALGPIRSKVWEWRRSKEGKYSVDIQTLPGSKHKFIELSLKTVERELAKKRRALASDLKGRGLILPEDQSGRRPLKLRGLLKCSAALRAPDSRAGSPQTRR